MDKKKLKLNSRRLFLAHIIKSYSICKNCGTKITNVFSRFHHCSELLSDRLQSYKKLCEEKVLKIIVQKNENAIAAEQQKQD